ncbi:MAG: MarR family winged helix-turn-helix transcriptional regulator [Candidatus Acidiferrales bacterium]
MPIKRATRHEKKRRAWEAYVDLVQAADWVHGRVRTFLDTLGLSTEEFHLLAMLHHDGPLTVSQAMAKRQRDRKNTYFTIRQAEEFGWVKWQVSKYSQTEASERGLATDRHGGHRHGPRVGVVSLTPAGEKLISKALPNHGKVVNSLMRKLEGRERQSLSRLCRKLRREDAFSTLRYASGLIRAHDEDEEDDSRNELAHA